MKYYLYIFLSLAIFSSCARVAEDEIDENYQKLFPFTGIDKPETSYEDMNVTPCDPEIALSAYQYPGVIITDEVREYEVTLRCKYQQDTDNSGAPNIMVRYIAPDKTLRVISSNKRDKDANEYMEKDNEKIITFKVYSGYPLYLSIHGTAPRGTSVTANISAHSLDGFVVVPTLKTTQNQNQEGTHPLPAPYCEYIILP